MFLTLVELLGYCSFGKGQSCWVGQGAIDSDLFESVTDFLQGNVSVAGIIS